MYAFDDVTCHCHGGLHAHGCFHLGNHLDPDDWYGHSIHPGDGRKVEEGQDTLDIAGEGNALLGDHGDMAGHRHWLVAWLHAHNLGAHDHLVEALVHCDHCNLRAIFLHHSLLAVVHHQTIGLDSGEEVVLDKGRPVVRRKEVAVDIGKAGMAGRRSWDDRCWEA